MARLPNAVPVVNAENRMARALGVSINFANIIALPLLLGVGVSFNVYFVMNWRTGMRQFIGSATARANRAVSKADISSVAITNRTSRTLRKTIISTAAMARVA